LFSASTTTAKQSIKCRIPASERRHLAVIATAAAVAASAMSVSDQSSMKTMK